MTNTYRHSASLLKVLRFRSYGINGISKKEPALIKIAILPKVPRLPSLRSKVADSAFVLVMLCARLAFVIGAVIGGSTHGFVRLLAGLAVGALVGFGVGRSLGLRGRNVTQGYFIRMYDRGCGKRAGKLEQFVERVRGNRLSMMQCRLIACAYAEAARQLQSCGSKEEQMRILTSRDQKILNAAYGQERAATSTPTEKKVNAEIVLH